MSSKPGRPHSEAIVKVLEKYPFKKAYYSLALHRRGEDQDDLERYAQLFGVEVQSIIDQIELKKERQRLFQEFFDDEVGEVTEKYGDYLFFKQLRENFSVDSWENVVTAYNGLEKFIKDHLFTSPVPEKKLKNAAEKFANFGDETPLFFYDNTFMKSGKEGILITAERTYFQDSQGPWEVETLDIDVIEPDSGDLSLMGHTVKLSYFNKAQAKELAAFLELALFVLKKSGYIVPARPRPVVSSEPEVAKHGVEEKQVGVQAEPIEPILEPEVSTSVAVKEKQAESQDGPLEPVVEPESSTVEVETAQRVEPSSKHVESPAVETRTEPEPKVETAKVEEQVAPKAGKGAKSKITAAILAIFLGTLGIHKFYLGKVLWGVIYLLFSWTGIPTVIGFIEGLILLIMNKEKFAAKYS